MHRSELSAFMPRLQVPYSEKTWHFKWSHNTSTSKNMNVFENTWVHTHRGSVSTLIAQPLPKTCCNERCYSGPWGMTAQPAASFLTQSAAALWGCEDGWLQHCPVMHNCAGKRKWQISSFSDNLKEYTLRGTEQQPRSQYFLKKKLQSAIIFSSKYLLPNIGIHTCDPHTEEASRRNKNLSQTRATQQEPFSKHKRMEL